MSAHIDVETLLKIRFCGDRTGTITRLAIVQYLIISEYICSLGAIRRRIGVQILAESDVHITNAIVKGVHIPKAKILVLHQIQLPIAHMRTYNLEIKLEYSAVNLNTDG